MSENEPSDFALGLSGRLLSGEEFELTEGQVFQLSEYEIVVLCKTARKNGYAITYFEPEGTYGFEKDRRALSDRSKA